MRVSTVGRQVVDLFGEGCCLWSSSRLPDKHQSDSKAPAPADVELGARKEASTGRPSAMLPPEATSRDPCDQKELEQEWGGQPITQDEYQEITNIRGRISTASSANVQIWVDKKCAFSREKTLQMLRAGRQNSIPPVTKSLWLPLLYCLERSKWRGSGQIQHRSAPAHQPEEDTVSTLGLG